MKSAFGLFLAALSAVLGLAFYWFLAPRAAPFGMFEGGQGGISRLLLSYGATVVGVILGSVYRELRALQAKGVPRIENVSTFLGQIGRSVDLWLGLVGSPIVYALLLKASDGMNLSGLIIVALENGFCCLIILNSLMGKADGGANDGTTEPANTRPG